MSIPQISVCMPAYNVAPYIDKCIESILTQNFSDFELIIVEDCSADDTLAKIESRAEKDGRIKLLRHTVNKGVAESYNDALQAAAGKYVAIIDSDDYILPGYLDILRRVAEDNEADAVQMAFESFTEANGQENTCLTWSFPDQAAMYSPDLAKRAARFCPVHLHIAPWGKLYRREFLEKMKMRFYTAEIATDVLFHYQGLIAAPRYLGLPLRLYRYRERTGSLSHTLEFSRNIEAYFSAMVKQTKLLSAWLRETNLWDGNRSLHRAALDGFIQHYRYFFARQAKEIGADKVLTALDEMAEKTYGENAPAFQSTLRLVVLSRLREISTPPGS